MIGGSHARRAAPLRTVELVGPAGAGKSSIGAELATRHTGRIAPGGLWGLPRLGLLRHACALLPAGTRGIPSHRPHAVADTLLHLARVRTLHGLVHADPPTGALRLLDEGPVFGLAWLRMRRAGLVHGGPLEAAWRDAAVHWAHTLDAIFWLDAPDAVLARRIRERPKPHMMKGAHAGEVAAFAASFRAALDAVIEAMGADAPRLVRISTALGTPQAAAARIAAVLGLDGRAA